MSDADRRKWDTRYRQGSYEARTYPSPFLEQWLDRIPRGRALDVACGAGRNALRLAEAGFTVEGVDIAPAALERAAAGAAQRGLTVSWKQADLDTTVPPAERYALVSVIRYMNRLLMPHLASALVDGGWLVFEHHFQTPREVSGPRDDGFRLRPQELLQTYASLRVVHYQEAIVVDPDGRTMALARLVACKGDPGF
jgi:SAM-dependent methyltransferase